MMNHNILLVDDDPGMIQFMGRILADSANLQFASGGEDAMRLVRQSAPDLMLLDAMMPGMNGFQVLDALKAEPQLADVPVIFVTGQSGAMWEGAGFQMGAGRPGCLTSPTATHRSDRARLRPGRARVAT